MHYWSNCGPFKNKIEGPDAEILIFNLRQKIWDFSNVWTQKWVRPKCHCNAILVLFEYVNLVKISKNLQKILKRRFRRRFERFAPENWKPCNRPPPSGQNPAIETEISRKRNRKIEKSKKTCWSLSAGHKKPQVKFSQKYFFSPDKLCIIFLHSINDSTHLMLFLKSQFCNVYLWKIELFIGKLEFMFCYLIFLVV